MKKRRSVRVQVTALLLVVFVPIVALTVVASSLLVRQMQTTVQDNKTASLLSFAGQANASLDLAKEQINLLTLNSSWNALREPPGSVQYEFAKARLWQEVTNILTVLPVISGIHVQVDSSAHDFITRNKVAILMDESDRWRSYFLNRESSFTWEVIDWEGHPCLIYTASSRRMDIGIIVKIDTLFSQWNGAEGESLELVPYQPLKEQTHKNQLLFENTGHNYSFLLTTKGNTLEGIPLFYLLILGVSLLTVALIPILYMLLNHVLVKPLRHIEESIDVIRTGDVDYRIDNFDTAEEFYVIETTFNDMLDQTGRLRIEAYDEKIEKQKAQLESLRLQINPHLLFNSLNSIYSLAQTHEYESVQSFVLDLVQYFRYSLRNTDELVPLVKELDFIHGYLKIQQVRFPHCFEVIWMVDDTLLDVPVPPLIIQNFVENSTKYGIIDDKTIQIVISVQREKDKMMVVVEDNGKGISPTVLKEIRAGRPVIDKRGKHVGIWNCVRRLRLVYGDAANIRIDSIECGGTQVFTKFPIGGQSDDAIDC